MLYYNDCSWPTQQQRRICHTVCASVDSEWLRKLSPSVVRRISAPQAGYLSRQLKFEYPSVPDFEIFQCH